MGFSSLPKVAVPLLPVMLLFGKMNGERRMEQGGGVGGGAQLESVQKVWEEGAKGCSREVIK